MSGHETTPQAAAQDFIVHARWSDPTGKDETGTAHLKPMALQAFWSEYKAKAEGLTITPGAGETEQDAIDREHGDIQAVISSASYTLGTVAQSSDTYGRSRQSSSGWTYDDNSVGHFEVRTKDTAATLVGYFGMEKDGL